MAGKYHDDDIVILEATRSIIGSGSGSLKDMPVDELGAYVVEGLLERVEKKSSKFKREQIDQMVCGLSIGAGLAQNVPRQICKHTNMNEMPSAFVINEMCASGMESIIQGIRILNVGDCKYALVGGVENVSQSPFLITTEQLIEWQDKKVEEIQMTVKKADMYDGLWDKLEDVHTIYHAENTTKEWVDARGLDHDEFKLRIDDYAFLSHERAKKAIEAGAFNDEIILSAKSGDKDENPAKKNIKIMNKRAGTQFTPDGVFLSNHNSPPLANGAAFLLITKYKDAKELGIEPMAKITGYGYAGTTPEKFLLAPIGAVNSLLQKTGTKIADYDLIEANSAFGSQMIFNQEELGLDMDKTNVFGDCIALGHPIGAAGARILTTLLYGLIHNQQRLGLASICLGGGNGLAMSIERMS